MPGDSKIEWTEATWNPVTGCTKVSAGCDHCYAETFAERFRGVPGHPYEQGFDLRLWPERLELPLRWTKPRTIFVDSMTDLFHTDVPDDYIDQVFAVMAMTPQHTYQILTKRPQRMERYFRHVETRGMCIDAAKLAVTQRTYDPWRYGSGQIVPLPLPNVWLGVSVEDQAAAYRIGFLAKTPAAVRFLSCEPLIGELDLTRWLLPPCGACEGTGSGPTYDPLRYPGACMCGRCEGTGTAPSPLHWVILGGESGPGARPLNERWVRDLIDGCELAGVACFCKQLGSVWSKQHGGPARGGDPSYWPEALRVRQFPATAAT